MRATGLATHRLLMRLALSASHAFAWIFVFHYFYVRSQSVAAALAGVLGMYALVQILIVLLTPWSARLLRKGFRRPIVYGSLALSAAFAVLAASFAGYLGGGAAGVSIVAFLLALYRALYWIPYDAARDIFPSRESRTNEILLALVPAAAGIYLSIGGFAAITLLFAGAAFALASALVILRLPDMPEGFAWGYRETFHELFAPQNRFALWSSFFSGIEAAGLLMLWPLVVFMLLGWSYPMLGLVLSVSLLLTMAFSGVLRKQLEVLPPRLVPVIATSAWFMRLGVGGFVGAVLVDTYAHTGARAALRGVDILALEQAADSRAFVDEGTVVKEMGMALGRAFLAIAIVVAATALEPTAALALGFVLAGLAVGASTYLQHMARRFI